MATPPKPRGLKRLSRRKPEDESSGYCHNTFLAKSFAAYKELLLNASVEFSNSADSKLSKSEAKEQSDES